MLPHGIIIEWSKYHKKILKERYLRQTITISTKNTKYNARSIWKFACNCMDFGKWIHAHTWNQILMVSVCNPSYCPKTESHPSPFLFFFGVLYLFREGDKTAILKQLQKIEDVSNKNVPQCMGCCYPTFPSIATSKWKGMYFHDIRLIVDNFFSLVPADDLARSYLVLAALAQRFSFLSPCFSHSLLVFLTLVLCI
jgi:hypothetical protein